MPTGQNLFENQFERVLPASSVANMFPFSYSGKTDPQGMYIGRDANGSNIIVNFDQRGQDKTNGHIIILEMCIRDSSEPVGFRSEPNR